MRTDHWFATATLTPEQLDAELLQRWDALLPGQHELGERLVARYAERQRRYHDRAHLLTMLRAIDDLAADQDLVLVRLAAWYHDAVYDIPERELSNEEASARLSVRELGRAGFEQEDLTQVARLVRLTADHLPGTRDPEGALLCDADLVILAAPPERYADYVAAVREEYAAVPDERFWSGRLAVLEPLADGEVFRSSRAQSIKAAARANLDREVDELRELLGLEPRD